MEEDSQMSNIDKNIEEDVLNRLEQGQPDLAEEAQPEINQEMQHKFSETLTRFNDQMKDFREGQKNTFIVENPHEFELYHIIRVWNSRPCKNQKFLLYLQLSKSEIPIEKIKQYFDLLPSIQVYYNGDKLQNNGILTSDSEYFYEGNDKYMHIYSQTRATDYEGEVLNKSPHGKGNLVCRNKKDGFYYMGHFFEGRYHGTGELRNSKNVIYIGEFKNDFKEGKGVEMIMKRKKNPTKGEQTLIRKSMYNGEFKEGFRCGVGIEETTHAVYNGEWKGGVKSGKGEMIYKNGDKYDGSWENNQFSGDGNYVEKGNCQYKGSFLEGRYHGDGVMQYENGDKYEGCFVKGKKHGQGIYTWADGDYYDGEWMNDSAEGKGTSMIGTDFYDGDFKNGKKHGIGQLTNEQGDVIKAQWQNNVCIQVLARNGEPQN